MRRGVVATVAGLLLGAELDAAVGVAEDLERLAARWPAPERRAYALALETLAGAAAVVARARLDRLGPERREAVARALAGAAPTRALLEAVKPPLLLVSGARRARADVLRRAAAARLRPVVEARGIPAEQWPGSARADAVVVGSGAGGAFAARELARAGLRVVVLEEGHAFGAEELRATEPLERFASLYRDGGATLAVGRPPVLVPVGRGLGGTTLVNSGTCYRTPARVLRRWAVAEGVAFAEPDALAPLFEEVEATLGVAPVPEAVLGPNGRVALEGAARLGWRAAPLRRNAPGCEGTCQCAIGCPARAKAGVHLNALPEAEAAGAALVTGARVERVLVEGARVTGVRARRSDGTVVEVAAPLVVVAAGATETPPLLRRSGLARHPLLGHGLALHPAVGVAGVFEEEIHPTEGVLQSVGIEELHERDHVLVEATAAPAGMGSVAVPGVGRALAARLAKAEHVATLGAMVGDAPAGRVHGSRRALLRYDLRAEDGARLLRAVEAMGRVLFAAGATEVWTGLRRTPVVRRKDELREAVAKASPADLHLAAFHPSGSARMGADPQRAPVDERGALRGVRGVLVADASALPSCPEVNPQVTIMAIALAVARAALGDEAVAGRRPA